MRLLKDFPLRDKNTYRIGGFAKYYSDPVNQQELIDCIEIAQKENLPIFILGKGSNVLISDSGWSGLVINISTCLNKLKYDSDFIETESGVLLNSLVNKAIEYGYGGMEDLAGIPGTVGGAVVMNAGAFNTCIAETLHSVRYYDLEKNEIVECKSGDLALGYRTSLLKNKPSVILSAKFHFSRKDNADSLIKSKRNILESRKNKQPLEYPNCGSVFKRPPGGYAGTMIEQCGLKGTRIGGAEVSAKHANFIINRENATASDVRRLIKTVQIKVFDKFGVILEPEVIFVGKFDEPLLENK